MIQLTILGRPQTRGSKFPVNIRRKDGSLVEKNGRPIIVTKDDNPKSDMWLAQVRDTAGRFFHGELIKGPVRVSIVFYLARRKGDFSTSKKNAGQLKGSAPPFHTTKPDVDKLTRPILDGCKGLIWLDDSQVCALTVAKDWTLEQERAEVVIEEIQDL